MLLLPEPDPIDLVALSDKAGVSPRTIRYYIQQGLLPAPESRGPGAHYGPEHVDRLRLIRRLQREHLPLSEIRRRLEKLPPEEIRRILATEHHEEPTSASEYVRRVLSEGLGTVKAPAVRALAAQPALFAEPSENPRLQKSLPVARAQWEHFTLAPDVELHVRRPVSREVNRRIERLLDAARDIFKEDLP